MSTSIDIWYEHILIYIYINVYQNTYKMYILIHIDISKYISLYIDIIYIREYTHTHTHTHTHAHTHTHTRTHTHTYIYIYLHTYVCISFPFFFYPFSILILFSFSMMFVRNDEIWQKNCTSQKYPKFFTLNFRKKALTIYSSNKPKKTYPTIPIIYIQWSWEYWHSSSSVASPQDAI